MATESEHSPVLRGFSGEVLVAVRARGLVVAHQGGEAVLGWRDGLDGPRALADVFAATDLPVVESAMGTVTAGGSTAIAKPLPVLRSDQGSLPMRVEVFAVTEPPGAEGWVLRLRTIGSTDDEQTPTTDLVQLELLAERFVSLAESLAAGILISDPVGSVDYANPAARELLWRTDDELAGSGWLDTIHADDREVIRSACEQVLRTGTNELVEFRIDLVGIERWVQARLTTVTTSAGRPGGWVAVLSDITTERATADELSRQATHDALTGLPNRTLLRDRLTQAQARVRRSGAPLALLFVDLNDFKAINDDHGHRVGDEVLKEVAERIRTVIRAEDTAARLGGDEFVVVAEGLTRAVADKVAQRIGDAVRAPIDVGRHRFEVGCAIGVAWSAAEEVDPNDVLHRADLAMYEAKRSGERIAFSDPS